MQHASTIADRYLSFTTLQTQCFDGLVPFDFPVSCEPTKVEMIVDSNLFVDQED